MEKINIAQLLKDCPSGMELDCAMYDDCQFLDVDTLGDTYLIRIKTPCGIKYLDKYGCYTINSKSKCVIFPKGKTTWEGFVPPCKFKDGDIVYIKTKVYNHIIIFKDIKEGIIKKYVNLCNVRNLIIDNSGVCHTDKVIEIRHATKEEKQKLFGAIKENGYKWNPETKTLEKLVIPKFKVGDEIVERNSISNSWIVCSVSSEYYGLKLPNGSENIGALHVSEQDDWELVPNIFDISTLKPFDKVLVRDCNTFMWNASLFSHIRNKKFFCIGAWYNQCIPYGGNEHLLGTTNDCDNCYKTWEE